MPGSARDAVRRGTRSTGSALPLSSSVRGSPQSNSGSTSPAGRHRRRGRVPGLGRRLQPRRGVHRVAERGVLDPAPGADRADARPARSSTPTRTPNPSMPQRPLDLAPVLGDLLDDPEAARTARSASSSWAIGAPNSASTPSPARSFTVPPNASTAPIIRATASPTMSLSSSGSSRSPSGGRAHEVGEERGDDPPLLPHLSAQRAIIADGAMCVRSQTGQVVSASGINRRASSSMASASCRRSSHAVGRPRTPSRAPSRAPATAAFVSVSPPSETTRRSSFSASPGRRSAWKAAPAVNRQKP